MPAKRKNDADGATKKKRMRRRRRRGQPVQFGDTSMVNGVVVPEEKGPEGREEKDHEEKKDAGIEGMDPMDVAWDAPMMPHEDVYRSITGLAPRFDLLIRGSGSLTSNAPVLGAYELNFTRNPGVPATLQSTRRWLSECLKTLYTSLRKIKPGCVPEVRFELRNDQTNSITAATLKSPRYRPDMRNGTGRFSVNDILDYLARAVQDWTDGPGKGFHDDNTIVSIIMHVVFPPDCLPGAAGGAGKRKKKRVVISEDEDEEEEEEVSDTEAVDACELGSWYQKHGQGLKFVDDSAGVDMPHLADSSGDEDEGSDGSEYDDDPIEYMTDDEEVKVVAPIVNASQTTYLKKSKNAPFKDCGNTEGFEDCGARAMTFLYAHKATSSGCNSRVWLADLDKIIPGKNRSECTKAVMQQIKNTRFKPSKHYLEQTPIFVRSSMTLYATAEPAMSFGQRVLPSDLVRFCYDGCLGAHVRIRVWMFGLEAQGAATIVHQTPDRRSEVVSDERKRSRHRTYRKPSDRETEWYDLLLADDHYYAVTRPGGFKTNSKGKEHYYCDTCEDFTSNFIDHKCKSRCLCCMTLDCPDSMRIDESMKKRGKGTGKGFVPCGDCGRMFFGDECYATHKRKLVGSKRFGSVTPCELVYYCPKPQRCTHQLFRNNCKELRSNHVCMDVPYVKCPNCYMNVARKKAKITDTSERPEPIYHPCFIMKPRNPFKLKIRQNVWYFDAETFQAKSVDSAGADVFKHSVNFINVQFSTGSESVDFKTIEEFGAWVLEGFGKDEGKCIVAHNARGFDAHLLREYLINHTTIEPETIFSGTKIMKMVLPWKNPDGKTDHKKSIIVLDSLNFLTMPLKGLTDMFKLDCAKTNFPHLFNTPENQAYVGSIPHIKYYEVHRYSEKDLRGFMPWYFQQVRETTAPTLCLDVEAVIRSYKDCVRSYGHVDESVFAEADGAELVTYTGDWNFEAVMSDYCRMDVTVLREGFECFRNMNIGMFSGGEDGDIDDEEGGAPTSLLGIDPLMNTTIASTAQKLFLCKWYKSKTLATFTQEFVDKIGRPAFHGGRTEAWVILKILIYLLAVELAKPKVTITFPDGSEVVVTPETLRKFMAFTQLLSVASEITKAQDQVKKAVDELREKYAQLRQIKYVDVVSLYPFINKYGWYVSGHAIVINNLADAHKHLPASALALLNPGNPSLDDLVPWFVEAITDPKDTRIAEPVNGIGCIKLDFQAPANLRIPVLPAMDPISGKLVFDVKLHEGDVVCTPELELALKMGYKLTNVKSIHWWPKIKCVKGLFKEYVDAFLTKKMEAAGWMGAKTAEEKAAHIAEFWEVEGIKLDPDKLTDKKNGGLYKVAKLFLNSLWGKFNQRSNMWQDKEFEITAENRQAFWDLITDVTLETTWTIIVPNKRVIVRFRSMAADIEPPRNTNIMVGVLTTGQARCLMYREMAKMNPEQLLYMDTDSLVYVMDPSRADYHVVPLGKHLGEFTDEMPDSHIFEFIGAGPKNYGLAHYDFTKFQSLQYPSENSTLLKIKGFNLYSGYGDRNSAQNALTYDSVKRLVIASTIGLDNPRLTAPVKPHRDRRLLEDTILPTWFNSEEPEQTSYKIQVFRIIANRKSVLQNKYHIQRSYNWVFNKREVVLNDNDNLNTITTIPFGYNPEECVETQAAVVDDLVGEELDEDDSPFLADFGDEEEEPTWASDDDEIDWS